MRFNSIVILTGAGLSAESGLGTFRGKDGLWTRFNLDEVATPEGFARNPAARARVLQSPARLAEGGASRMRRITRLPGSSRSTEARC